MRDSCCCLVFSVRTGGKQTWNVNVMDKDPSHSPEMFGFLVMGFTLPGAWFLLLSGIFSQNRGKAYYNPNIHWGWRVNVVVIAITQLSELLKAMVCWQNMGFSLEFHISSTAICKRISGIAWKHGRISQLCLWSSWYVGALVGKFGVWLTVSTGSDPPLWPALCVGLGTWLPSCQESPSS